ncbi:MAG: MarR family transcriptional regulator [Alphaproteobacteria bacterium]|jgi:DNA-binding MarR family transcriptional regulator|nr:MarR family transcriptional regulator [Rhodospirillaceae bacterium]MDG2481658.1 MarR family transcriptional regulator [Alphaproteobacteria bacterium]MBT6204837.1 MarR family transcriptional regulator [Rhodospirillaceae bacterium]MBT6510412.1 MarR family transcriptional regulator [Rhodospirillaceae bacterium]MBT7615357.1 MarR family transcriptional regulator [Rhodospirillaceae bacterium]
MADVNREPNPLFLRDEELREAIEMLFFAYRDFTARPDAILAQHGFGRAHHRVIYFVGRHPGITVKELLAILKITKQSLARVLRQLVTKGFVEQRQGVEDRRHRLLYLTELGADLETKLTADQRARIARAYREAGAEAVAGYRRVLTGMVDNEDRARIAQPRRGP